MQFAPSPSGTIHGYVYMYTYKYMYIIYIYIRTIKHCITTLIIPTDILHSSSEAAIAHPLPALKQLVFQWPYEAAKECLIPI